MSNLLCDLQTNYLQNNGFQLILPRFPLVAFYSQNFVFPSINLPAPKINTPYSKIPFAGDEVEFEPFSFSFILDDRLMNYREIYDWMISIGYSKSHADFTNFKNKGKDGVETLGEQDATIAILSAKSNPVAHIVFRDAIPVSLSGFEFTTQDTNTTYMMATATFEYTYFEFVK